MKYNGRLIMIPWLHKQPDGTETRNWTRVRFNGVVDRRRLKREMFRVLKDLLGRKVHPIEVRNLLRASLPLHGGNEYAA